MIYFLILELKTVKFTNYFLINKTFTKRIGELVV